MQWQITGVIISIVGLTLAILAHLWRTGWWMGTLTETLKSLRESVEKIESRMERYEADHVRKEDIYRDMGKLENNIEAAHKRIDALNTGGHNG